MKTPINNNIDQLFNKAKADDQNLDDFEDIVDKIPDFKNCLNININNSTSFNNNNNNNYGNIPIPINKSFKKFKKINQIRLIYKNLNLNLDNDNDNDNDNNNLNFRFKNIKPVFIPLNDTKEYLINAYNFQIEEYLSTETVNRSEGSEKIQLSNIRPYGKWYESFFGENKSTYFCKNGVLSVSKEDIIKKPKSYYEQLIKEVETPNPEQGHYLERSWEAVFYPMKTVFIQN